MSTGASRHLLKSPPVFRERLAGGSCAFCSRLQPDPDPSQSHTGVITASVVSGSRDVQWKRCSTDVRRVIVVRTDSARATAEFVWGCWDRDVRFSVTARTNTQVTRAVSAIAGDPSAWSRARRQNGKIREGAGVAEATAYVDLWAWPPGTLLISRREPLHSGGQQSLFPDLELCQLRGPAALGLGDEVLESLVESLQVRLRRAVLHLARDHVSFSILIMTMPFRPASRSFWKKSTNSSPLTASTMFGSSCLAESSGDCAPRLPKMQLVGVRDGGGKGPVPGPMSVPHFSTEPAAVVEYRCRTTGQVPVSHRGHLRDQVLIT